MSVYFGIHVHTEPEVWEKSRAAYLNFRTRVKRLISIEKHGGKRKYTKILQNAVIGEDFHVDPGIKDLTFFEIAKDYMKHKVCLETGVNKRRLPVETYAKAIGLPWSAHSIHIHSTIINEGLPPRKKIKQLLSEVPLITAAGDDDDEESVNVNDTNIGATDESDDVNINAYEFTQNTQHDANDSATAESDVEYNPYEFTQYTDIDGAPTKIVPASIREVEDGVLQGYNDFPDDPVIFNLFNDEIDYNYEVEDNNMKLLSDDTVFVEARMSLYNKPLSESQKLQLESFLAKDLVVRFNSAKNHFMKSVEIKRLLDQPKDPQPIPLDIIINYMIILNDAELKRMQYQMTSRRVLYLPLGYFKLPEEKQAALNLFSGYSTFIYLVYEKSGAGSLNINIIVLNISKQLEFDIVVVKFERNQSERKASKIDKYSDDAIAAIQKWIYSCSKGYGINYDDTESISINVTDLNLLNDKDSLYSPGVNVLLFLSCFRAWTVDGTLNNPVLPDTSIFSQISYELISKKVIDWKVIDKERQYNVVRMLPSLASGSSGGSPLDTLPRTLPLLIHKLYHLIQTYGITTIKSLGGGGNFENFNICLAMQSFKLNLLYLTFELTYCNEVKKNAIRGLKAKVDASFGKSFYSVSIHILSDLSLLDRMLYVMGLTYESWTPLFYDCASSLFMTTAILPPLDMAKILMSEMMHGTSHFVIPQRNTKLFKLLESANIHFYEKIPVKLCVSNETLLLMIFVVDCSDAIILYT
jgi:hypothetical protein